MRKEVIILILFLFILPFMSADVLDPGQKSVEITNYITNMGEFPDYVFISGSKGGLGVAMCPLEKINNDGKIPGYYKFCDVSVYAVPKDNFDEGKMKDINSNESYGDEEISRYFDLINATEVISNIEVYATTSVISTETSRENYYLIDMQGVKNVPNESSTGRNSQVYILLAISFIAFSVIVFFIVKRFNKQEK